MWAKGIYTAVHEAPSGSGMGPNAKERGEKADHRSGPSSQCGHVPAQNSKESTKSQLEPSWPSSCY